MDVRHLIGKVAGVPRTRGMSLIYTLTGGPGGNFPRVCGDMCGDEPDRHAYMLDFGHIIVYLSRTQFQCMPEKATCQPTLAVHYRRLSSTQACLKRTDFSGSSLCN